MPENPKSRKEEKKRFQEGEARNKIIDAEQKKEIGDSKAVHTSNFDSGSDTSQQKTGFWGFWGRILSFLGLSGSSESKTPEGSNFTRANMFGSEEDIASQTGIDDVLRSSENVAVVAVQDKKTVRRGSTSSNDYGLGSGSISESKESFSQSYIDQTSHFSRSASSSSITGDKALPQTPYTGHPKYGSAPNLSTRDGSGEQQTLDPSGSSRSIGSSGYGSEASLSFKTASIGKPRVQQTLSRSESETNMSEFIGNNPSIPRSASEPVLGAVGKQVRMGKPVTIPVVPPAIEKKSSSMPNIASYGAGVASESKKPTRVAPLPPKFDDGMVASDSLKVENGSSSMPNLSHSGGKVTLQDSLENLSKKLTKIQGEISLPSQKLHDLINLHKEVSNLVSEPTAPIMKNFNDLQSSVAQTMLPYLRSAKELKAELEKLTKQTTDKAQMLQKLGELNVQTQSMVDYVQDKIDPQYKNGTKQEVRGLKEILTASSAEGKKHYTPLEELTKELADINTEEIKKLDRAEEDKSGSVSQLTKGSESEEGPETESHTDSLKILYNMRAETLRVEKYLTQTPNPELKKELAAFKKFESEVSQKIEKFVEQHLAGSFESSESFDKAVGKITKSITTQDSLSATEKVEALQKLHKHLEFKAEHAKNQTKNTKEVQALEKVIPSVYQIKWQTFVDGRSSNIATLRKDMAKAPKDSDESIIKQKIYTIDKTLNQNENTQRMHDNSRGYGELSSFNKDDKKALAALKKELKKEMGDLKKPKKDSAAKSGSHVENLEEGREQRSSVRGKGG